MAVRIQQVRVPTLTDTGRNRSAPPDLPRIAVWHLAAAPRTEPDASPAWRLRAGRRKAAAGVVLPAGGEALAREWLGEGAERVYVGEAALRDSDVVARLAADFGAARVGVYAPARRMPVSWSMDTESNADFRIMRPSMVEPTWEILTAGGSPTGTHAAWWIGEMLRLGAGSAIVRADIEDDADLNILAALVDAWGERLWFGPLRQTQPDIEPWIRLARARQLVVSDGLYREHPYLAALDEAASAPRKNAPRKKKRGAAA